MANRTFNAAKVEIMQGSHGFDNGGDAFGLVLCMTGNNIDAASKVGTANDLTDLTMDEYDGHLRVMAVFGPSFYPQISLIVLSQTGDTLERTTGLKLPKHESKQRENRASSAIAQL